MEGSSRRYDGVHISYKTATTQHDSGQRINMTKDDLVKYTKVSSDDFSDEDSLSKIDNNHQHTDNEHSVFVEEFGGHGAP